MKVWRWLFFSDDLSLSNNRILDKEDRVLKRTLQAISNGNYPDCRLVIQTKRMYLFEDINGPTVTILGYVREDMLVHGTYPKQGE